MAEEKKKMTVAEEVFIIVRELSCAGFFETKDWKKAWKAVGHNREGASLMSAGMALKKQVEHGTIVKCRRGYYEFVSIWSDNVRNQAYVSWQDRLPTYPLY